MNPWNDSDAFAREAAKVESAGEAVLLALLWWRRAGWTVRTQERVLTFRIDLVVPEAMVAIEVDSFEGHGSGSAMEHDARKRNAVVAAGWAPLTFSARDTLFRSQDTLADILAHVERRLRDRAPRPSEAAPRPAFDPAAFVMGARGLVEAMEQTFAPVKAAPSWRGFADRSPRERLALELVGVALVCPRVLDEPAVDAALKNNGIVALATAETIRKHAHGGTLNRRPFLADCPAYMSAFAFEVLHAPFETVAADARARALDLARQIGGA